MGRTETSENPQRLRPDEDLALCPFPFPAWFFLETKIFDESKVRNPSFSDLAQKTAVILSESPSGATGQLFAFTHFRKTPEILKEFLNARVSFGNFHQQGQT
ncbi:hypothetical protein [Deinococcus cellulosilyticus]|uniref:hypothetical protein n=1 Tax=Deinococcus cellulosilyticus TaxID=401558 RepID=UPI0011BEC3EB|nr:hypothetical protein [Deinococcus cellulosilyticus]